MITVYLVSHVDVINIKIRNWSVIKPSKAKHQSLNQYNNILNLTFILKLSFEICCYSSKLSFFYRF